MIASGIVLEGSRPPKSSKNVRFLKVFIGFLHFRFVRLCWLWGLILGASWLPLGALVAAFWVQVGVLGRPLPPKSASLGAFRRPSWPPGGSWGLQVGVLGRLGLQVGFLSQLWASKLASKVGFWPPSWPLGELLASKLASWASFWRPSWALGLALGLQVGVLGRLDEQAFRI